MKRCLVSFMKRETQTASVLPHHRHWPHLPHTETFTSSSTRSGPGAVKDPPSLQGGMRTSDQAASPFTQPGSSPGIRPKKYKMPSKQSCALLCTCCACVVCSSERREISRCLSVGNWLSEIST